MKSTRENQNPSATILNTAEDILKATPMLEDTIKSNDKRGRRYDSKPRGQRLKETETQSSVDFLSSDGRIFNRAEQMFSRLDGYTKKNREQLAQDIERIEKVTSQKTKTVNRAISRRNSNLYSIDTEETPPRLKKKVGAEKGLYKLPVMEKTINREITEEPLEESGTIDMNKIAKITALIPENIEKIALKRLERADRTTMNGERSPGYWERIKLKSRETGMEINRTSMENEITRVDRMFAKNNDAIANLISVRKDLLDAKMTVILSLS